MLDKKTIQTLSLISEIVIPEKDTTIVYPPYTEEVRNASFASDGHSVYEIVRNATNAAIKTLKEKK